jgi:membrane-bound lytic murein transglycosylase D
MPRTPFRASALSALLLAALSACGGPRPVAAPAPEPLPLPELPAPEPDGVGEGFEIEAGAAPRTASAGLLGSAAYDLPVEANRWVEMELQFLTTQRHAVVGRWLERADRYEEFVRDVFARYGMPRDLHHLAMVESGYQPTVRSRAGAVGMWQFMPATGRGMGLRIDDLVDERMDPVRSTHAAARHLAQLHRHFGGNWPLAAAAYNAGTGRISRGLGRFGATNFWDLAERGDLAQETRHYVPRLYAVTIIAKDRARFGYPAPGGVVRRFRYDSVRVDVPTPLVELARIGSFPVTELSELNPHLFRGLAPANYWVWVPHGQGPALQTAYQESDFRRRGGVATYTLRRGESLATITAASGLTADQVRNLNLSTNVDRLGPGDRVRLYADAARVLSERPAARLASRDGESSRRRSSSSSDGEASDDPDEARRASFTRAQAEADRDEANTREPSSRRSGSSSSASSSSESRRNRSESSSSSSSSESRRSESSSSSSSSESRRSRSESSSSSSGEGRSHTVEEGETLWGLARRYDVTVARLREANDLREDQAIQPGQRLRIPRAAPSSSSSSSSQRTASGGGERSRARTAEHVVKSGDTLWSIARTYESSVEAIREANDLRADAAIQPGQKLRVPRSAGGGQR